MIRHLLHPTMKARGARRSVTHALLAAALAAVSCSSSPASHLQDARQALADAAYSDVIAAADAGLRADPDPRTAWALELAKLEGLARSGRGDEAVALLERLAAAHPDRVGPTQYCATSDQLRGAGSGPAAIQALDLGAKHHPDDAVIAKLIGDSMSGADVNPAELEMLRSLGYVQ